MIGGVYRIGSWFEDDGQELHPPLAHGRYVLVDGQVVSSLFKTDADGTRSIQALYGRYEIEEGLFSYGYDFGTLTTSRPDGTTETTETGSVDPMRYAATREGDAVRLSMDDGRRGFLVTTAEMRFFDNGQLRRIWERAAV